MTVYECSVHTHADWCDGKNSLAEMAAAACAAGVKHYGVSCHSHTPIPIDEGCVLDADMTAYRKAVLDLRAEYEGRMEILLGLEWESTAISALRGLITGSALSTISGGTTANTTAPTGGRIISFAVAMSFAAATALP